MSNIAKLAKAARPVSESDAGSPRQIDAENTFYSAVQKRVSKAAWEEYDRWCLKATVDERIDRGLKIVEESTHV